MKFSRLVFMTALLVVGTNWAWEQYEWVPKVVRRKNDSYWNTYVTEKLKQMAIKKNLRTLPKNEVICEVCVVPEFYDEQACVGQLNTFYDVYMKEVYGEKL